MIKAKVVFEGDNIIVNQWIIYQRADEWEVVNGKNSLTFIWLEDAVKYCLEN